MLSPGRISLLAADPELERLLTPVERRLADEITLPVHGIDAGPVPFASLINGPGAFAALVLDGILLQTVKLGEHTGLRLVGPGELVALRDAMPAALIIDASLRATVPTQLALFGDEFLYAARRMPRLMAGLHDRSSDQSDRTLAQMLICQLPRVDDRLLAMLWLVAETWGRVTSSGTVVPVRLTHAVLGGLIGARRSTVTLALKELTDRGAVLRQAEGWLLLEQPYNVGPSRAETLMAGPRRVRAPTVDWGAHAHPRSALTAPAPQPSAQLSEELNRTIERLSAEHRESSRRHEMRMMTLAQSRERLATNRRRITQERESRRRVPSS